MSRVIDQYQVKIAAACAEFWTPRTIQAEVNLLNQKILKTITRPAPLPDGKWDVIEVTGFLNEARILVETEAIAFAKCFSPLRWLWYLRRLPRAIFKGRLVTTAPYDFMLAESLASRSTNKLHDYQMIEGSLAYDTGMSSIRRVLRYCIKVLYLSDLHVSLRYAGKGAIFTFAEDALPSYSIDEELASAIALYDERSSVGREFLTHIGTIATSEGRETKASQPNILTLGWVTNPDWGPSLIGRLGEQVEVEVYVQFGLSLSSFDPIARLNADPRLSAVSWWRRETGVLLLLLASIGSILFRLDTSFSSLMRYGYMLVDKESLLRLLNLYFIEVASEVRNILPNADLPSSVDELLNSLDHGISSLWPVINRKIIYSTNQNGVYLDLATASQYLFRILEFPRFNGDIANARSEHFEHATQEMISDSPWAPTPDILQYRGRQLRINGNRITDIDALGMKDQTLLIVSCKSIIKLLLYDTGDYREVRNTYTRIQDSVDEWNAIRQMLVNDPVGDNYDFSNFQEIVAVVCTNDIFFTPQGSSTEFVTAELRAAVSFEELSRWLNTTGV